MSHSVFKDFDDEVNNDTADANVIVFIGKDGEVTVDQNALQDLIGMYGFIIREMNLFTSIGLILLSISRSR